MTTIYRDISLGRSSASALKDLRRWMPSLRSTCNSIGVTGRLLYDGQNFVSVLEGQQKHVDRIKHMIEIRLIDGPIRTLSADAAIIRDHFAWTLGFLYEEEHIKTVNVLVELEFPDRAQVKDIISRLCQASDSLA